ncbi:MAG: hypothetical protein IT497_07225 [Ottowia sp.]|nr:hypothetical protein [Ottowia sp.]
MTYLRNATDKSISTYAPQSLKMGRYLMSVFCTGLLLLAVSAPLLAAPSGDNNAAATSDKGLAKKVGPSRVQPLPKNANWRDYA